MYSFEQDHTAAARTTATFDTSYLQPCAAGRSLQLSSAHHHPGGQQVLRNAAGSAATATDTATQPRRAKSSSSKKQAALASRHSSKSRRSSTTVVATDVNNFRAMVQELTGFPPAAIFRPLPRRVHAASPFVAAGAGQGCGGAREQHGHASWEASNSSTTAAGGGGSSPDDAPAAPPVVLAAQQPQFAPLGVFDGLTDLGSPEFDSWGDLSID